MYEVGEEKRSFCNILKGLVMRLRCSIILVFFIPGGTFLAGNGEVGIDFPAMETTIIEPVIIENISVYVPAAKSGPFVNRACRAKNNLTFSLNIPAYVKHEKTRLCPPQTARILAELTAFYHSESLPLTIFNGWQWEYTYSVCQYESVSYDLAPRGGCWENGWEAILNLSCGASRMQVLELESLENFNTHKAAPSESIIEVKTFSSMRTRDGYPKERQL